MPLLLALSVHQVKTELIKLHYMECLHQWLFGKAITVEMASRTHIVIINTEIVIIVKIYNHMYLMDKCFVGF